ncbi:hypothetical protein HGRIS_006896 [Hohenbuehelia grisea]|uniref:alpha-1,6-mannosyl-glycoprotein 6-beta-N-acetylglucosaminyltransferase n=1 Tax=Hohenbuehelia grisea TaxID=104357 RepID=A0ABR3JAC9_9AGAR
MKWNPFAGEDSAHDYELLPSDGIHLPRTARTRRIGFRRERLVLTIAFLFALSSAIFLALDLFVVRKSWHGRDALQSVISHLWPVGSVDRTDSWENENSKVMNALFKCAMENNCRENQTSVVMLSSPHFIGILEGKTSGEDIWALSIFKSLQEMGYTTIIAPRNYEMARTYRQYPDLVKIIIAEGSAAEACFKDSACIKRPEHPLGVPAWKIFAMHFWTGSAHPLGSKWTLSPENFGVIAPHNSKDNFYLGYSIERTCREIPITPSLERPAQGYVFAKQISYFYGKNYAWPNISWEPPFDLKLYAGMRNDTNYPSEVPKGITNLGLLPKHEFYEKVGQSRVFIGVGSPQLSPSPYDALCMGVPFINPVRGWDKEDPENRHKWEAQHEGLRYEDPPYVYNVKTGDEKGLWEAIRQAVENPIDRYIPPAMTMEALKSRVGRLVEGDWRSKAVELLEERQVSGKGETFEI